MTLTDEQRELLEDKHGVWFRARHTGPIDLRDYNLRAAEALRVALSLASRAQSAEAALADLKAEVEVVVVGGLVDAIDYREDEHQRRSYAIMAAMPRAFHAARNLLAKLKGEG